MKRKLLALLLSYPILGLANPYDCPATKATQLPANTTVFAYQTVKNKKTFYIPFAAIVNGKLVEGREIQLPTATTLYNLRDDQPVKVRFKNEHDNVDWNVCRSIGQTAGTISASTVYATKPIANQFNFAPDAKDIAAFNTTVTNPCKDQKPHYDKYGVMTCYADALVATSHLENGTQYWHTKQYRHDLGFAVSAPEGKTVKQVIEDCAICKD